MRIAWFAARPPHGRHPIDDTRSLLAELRSRHAVELYHEEGAHDFVWRQWRAPVDVCVYELTDTPDAAFVWPYFLHYPGVVRLRSSRLRQSRRETLHRHRRIADDAAEAAFAGPSALRIPCRASRLVVVGDPSAARALQQADPAARIRHAPIAFPARARATGRQQGVPLVHVAAAPSPALVARAVQRARDAGSPLDVRGDADDPSPADDADAIVALEWPPRPEPPAAALYAMSAGLPAIVYEVPVTAGWPALDPQTWRPRGDDGLEPIVISIDPRDDEHSLMLALRRLSDDPPLRLRMGAAAHAWAQAHATVAQAAGAWERVLAEAATLESPPLPDDWPVHLTADGTTRARQLLAEMGVIVDFLGE